jgi:hypothetical protein
MPNSGTYYLFGAGGRTSSMITRLKRDIKGCISCQTSSIADGIDFGMSFSCGPVISPSDNFAVFNNYGTDHGVWRSKPLALFGKVECHLHKTLVVY